MLRMFESEGAGAIEIQLADDIRCLVIGKGSNSDCQKASAGSAAFLPTAIVQSLDRDRLHGSEIAVKRTLTPVPLARAARCWFAPDRTFTNLDRIPASKADGGGFLICSLSDCGIQPSF